MHAGIVCAAPHHFDHYVVKSHMSPTGEQHDFFRPLLTQSALTALQQGPP